MTAKWDENTTLKFVLEYKRHECLWNCKAAVYKNKTARDRAYRTIADAMAIAGFNVPEVKNKIKNLRSTYCQELKKISLRSKSGSSEGYTPAMKWFKEMDSILGSIQAARLAPIYMKIDTEETSVDFSDLADTIKPMIFHRNEDDFHFQTQFSKRRSKIPEVTTISHQYHEAPPSTTTCTNYDNDEFEAFGKYISLQLKKLSAERAIRAKEFIHTYLTEQRLEELHDTPLVARSSYSSRLTNLPYSRPPSSISKSPTSHPIESIDMPNFDFKTEYSFSDSS